MKKSLFIVTLFLATNHAFTQRTYKISYIALGYFNTDTKDYDWNSKQRVDLQLTIRGELFLINDEVGTYFIRGKQIDYQNTDEVLRFLWKCVDYNGKFCDIKEDIIKENGKYTGVFNLYIFYKRIRCPLGGELGVMMASIFNNGIPVLPQPPPKGDTIPSSSIMSFLFQNSMDLITRKNVRIELEIYFTAKI